ncbi:MAG: hypothetical protein ACREUC_17510, partial [Steroidobacteraceae bacterium]
VERALPLGCLQRERLQSVRRAKRIPCDAGCDRIFQASNPGISDSFGWDVALSDDGRTLAVSAIGEDSAAMGTSGIGEQK